MSGVIPCSLSSKMNIMSPLLKQELKSAEPGEDARHRLCAVTRERLPITDMIRFVVGPEEWIVPDIRNKLPGRGLWITASKSKVADAIRTKAFQRGLKRQLNVDAELPTLLESLLQKQAIDALSFANKAGGLILGFERLSEAIGAGKINWLVHACDAGTDGVAKLEAKLKAVAGQGNWLPGVVCFSNAQLSLALGRPNVVHAGIIDTPASRNFIEQTGRLQRYRSN